MAFDEALEMLVSVPKRKDSPAPAYVACSQSNLHTLMPPCLSRFPCYFLAALWRQSLFAGLAALLATKLAAFNGFLMLFLRSLTYQIGHDREGQLIHIGRAFALLWCW